MEIFTVLILHEHRIPSHLFVSSVSFINVLYFSVYRSFPAWLSLSLSTLFFLMLFYMGLFSKLEIIQQPSHLHFTFSIGWEMSLVVMSTTKNQGFYYYERMDVWGYVVVSIIIAEENYQKHSNLHYLWKILLASWFPWAWENLLI